ncbi:MAG: cytochrome c3 family protein [Bacteroidales bacterium]|nr:cytochrome c3 family protein [Bacteroidales bacterium]
MTTPTLLISILLLAVASTLTAQPDDTLKLLPSYFEVNDFVEDNEACLKCHGEIKYLLADVENDRSATKRMAPCKIIDRDKYYTSVHMSFSCTDCHSYDFMTFPHSMDSRFEEKLLCMDCHGYDETYAHYHFEAIETEFSESIHNIADFTCWSCHDPHSYKAFMRNADDLEEAILYDNNMCLRCHADYDRFSQKTEREEIVVVESHDWLPNQASHFAKVRCIECHTEVNDTILIAHKIMSKTDAVKNCTECHSKDSRLMHTLYKFESKEARKGGFVNAIMLNNSYVIGANQNVLLNWLSLLVFGMTLLVIAFHSFLRIRKHKKS